MIVNLIAGIITGFIVSVPPMGPIAFAMISRGFKNEVGEGRGIALGAAFMDFVFCLVAFAGINLIISYLPQSAEDFYTAHISLIEMLLTFTGCAVVILYGVKIIRSKSELGKLETEDPAKLNPAYKRAGVMKARAEGIAKKVKIPQSLKPRIKTKPAEIKRSKLYGMFFMGVLLCLSSVTVPASWIALVGYLKGFNFLNASFFGGFLFSVGAFLGTYGWFYLLLKLITWNKKRINSKSIKKLNVIAGIVLLIIGVILFVKALISLTGIYIFFSP